MRILLSLEFKLIIELGGDLTLSKKSKNKDDEGSDGGIKELNGFKNELDLKRRSESKILIRF